MAKTVSCHPFGESYREFQTYVSHATATLMCIRHTHASPCIILPPVLSFPSFAPTFILRGCGFGHFGTTYPSRAGPPPFWWGSTYTYARVHTQAYTRRRAERCSKSRQGKVKVRRVCGGGLAETTKGWSSLFRNLTCSERKTVKEEVSFRGTSGLGKRLNFYQPPFRHVSLPRALPHPAVPRRVHSLHVLNHGVTFLVGTSVPIFRRLLEGKFLLDIILIARVPGRRPSNFFVATRSRGKITHNPL